MCLCRLGWSFCSVELWNKVVTAFGNRGQCPKSGREARPLNEEWKKFVCTQLRWNRAVGTLWLMGNLTLSTSFYSPVLLCFSIGPLTRVPVWVMLSHDLLAACLSSGSVGHALTRASHHLLSINTATTLPSLHTLFFSSFSPFIQFVSLFKVILPVYLCVTVCVHKHMQLEIFVCISFLSLKNYQPVSLGSHTGCLCVD